MFSSYESHLSHFIGPVRAFQKLYGASKDYKFKSPNERTRVENFKEYGLENSFSISREDAEDYTFEFDRQKGEIVIKLVKHSYSPLAVYKSILKMALSCISSNDVRNYKLAFKYLHSDILDDKTKGVANLLIYSTPPGSVMKVLWLSYIEKKSISEKYVLMSSFYIL